MELKPNDPTYLESALKKYAAATEITIEPKWSEPFQRAAGKANSIIKISKYLGQKGEWDFLHLLKNIDATANSLNKLEDFVLSLREGENYKKILVVSTIE